MATPKKNAKPPLECFVGSDTQGDYCLYLGRRPRKSLRYLSETELEVIAERLPELLEPSEPSQCRAGHGGPCQHPVVYEDYTCSICLEVCDCGCDYHRVLKRKPKPALGGLRRRFSVPVEVAIDDLIAALYEKLATEDILDALAEYNETLNRNSAPSADPIFLLHATILRCAARAVRSDRSDADKRPTP